MSQFASPLVTTPGRCLLVDDEEDIARALCYHLARCGFATTVSRTLEEARARLGEQTWDLVIVDVMLPDGDGVDLISSVRDLPDPPKVVLTSVLTPYDLPDHHADSYLAKPFRGDDVSRAITSAGLDLASSGMI